MPAARSPAQIEAARRNGARSRGPVTPEGEARSRLNALRHGLAAADHLVLDGEDGAAYEELLRDLVEDFAPGTATEARLVSRLAAALWKQDRADRLEAEVLANPPAHDLVYAPDGSVRVSAEAGLNLARLNAPRAYQAQLGREASRCLRELRLLRKERAARTGEPESRDRPQVLSPPAVSGGPAGPGGPEDDAGNAAKSRNEPETPPAANANIRNGPEPRPAPPATTGGGGGAKRTREEDRGPFKSVPWPMPAPRRQAP